MSFVFVVEVVVYLVYYGPRKFFKSRLYWGLSILAVVGLASAIVEIATAMLQEHEFTCGGIPVPGLPTYTPLIVAQVGALSYRGSALWLILTVFFDTKCIV